jgi:hypothetical protein
VNFFASDTLTSVKLLKPICRFSLLRRRSASAGTSSGMDPFARWPAAVIGQVGSRAPLVTNTDPTGTGAGLAAWSGWWFTPATKGSRRMATAPSGSLGGPPYTWAGQTHRAATCPLDRHGRAGEREPGVESGFNHSAAPFKC